MNEQIHHIVEQLIKDEWANFAARHPHLAEALDELRVLRTISAAIADDPEYQKAMTDAAAAGAAADTIGGAVLPIIRKWLGRIL